MPLRRPKAPPRVPDAAASGTVVNHGAVERATPTAADPPGPVMIFEAVDGHPVPLLPRHPPDGRRYFDIDQAARHFGLPPSLLRMMWRATWGGLAEGGPPAPTSSPTPPPAAGPAALAGVPWSHARHEAAARAVSEAAWAMLLAATDNVVCRYVAAGRSVAEVEDALRLVRLIRGASAC